MSSEASKRSILLRSPHKPKLGSTTLKLIYFLSVNFRCSFEHRLQSAIFCWESRSTLIHMTIRGHFFRRKFQGRVWQDSMTNKRMSYFFFIGFIATEVQWMVSETEARAIAASVSRPRWMAATCHGFFSLIGRHNVILIFDILPSVPDLSPSEIQILLCMAVRLSTYNFEWCWCMEETTYSLIFYNVLTPFVFIGGAIFTPQRPFTWA